MGGGGGGGGGGGCRIIKLGIQTTGILRSTKNTKVY